MYHESFTIYEFETGWGFCKTARKPYDLLVCTCLIAAGTILGFSVTSDGDVDEWEPAFEFYNKVIGDAPKDIAKFLNKKPQN